MNYSVKVAKNLLKRYHTNNPYLLCEELNISVTFSDLPQHLQGFYCKVLGMPFVFINQTLCEQEQRAICAHELGHALLHPDINTLFLKQKTMLVSEKFEKEADLFATQLLIPQKLASYCFGEESIESLSFALGVPQRYIDMKKTCIE